MSSIANDADLSSERQLPTSSSSNTLAADQDALSPSAEMNDRAEVVEGLDLVPVPLESTWLKFDGVNEYAQLFNSMYNDKTKTDCGLPLILKEHGDPLALYIHYCDCDDEQDHTCWLDREFCGTRGKQGRRRRELVSALGEAVYGLKNGLLQMYRSSRIYCRDPQRGGLQAGRLTPGLHKLATMRLTSLTNGVKRLREFHEERVDTSPDEVKSASSAGSSDTDDKGFDDGESDGSDEDLADLERRLLACKTDLTTPLDRVPNTKASIIEATEDLKLAVRTYDDERVGPRSIVRKYYEKSVLQVADANSSLEHYVEHDTCDGLYCDLKDIDGSYRKVRGDLYRFYNSAEMSDGLAKILWSIWDETRSCFEDSSHAAMRGERGMGRPDDLGWDSDDDESLSSDEDPDDEYPEDDPDEDPDEDPEEI